ncbi:MAG TPA: hypothetical protein VE177_05445, partial [Candidatus Binatus sp.]|nr:hypothetical protein [Candidatus Binatus sp.]
MRLRILWKFATILMISRIRSVRQSVVTRAVSGRPLLVLVIDLIVMIAAVLAGFAVTIPFRTSTVINIQ